MRMFSYDHWCDWLRARQHEIAASGFDSDFTGGGNLNVDWPERSLAGHFTFWENGMCDFGIEGPNGPVVWEMGLEANDENLPQLFERFMISFGGPPKSA